MNSLKTIKYIETIFSTLEISKVFNLLIQEIFPNFIQEVGDELKLKNEVTGEIYIIRKVK